MGSNPVDLLRSQFRSLSWSVRSLSSSLYLTRSFDCMQCFFKCLVFHFSIDSTGRSTIFIMTSEYCSRYLIMRLHSLMILLLVVLSLFLRRISLPHLLCHMCLPSGRLKKILYLCRSFSVLSLIRSVSFLVLAPGMHQCSNGNLKCGQ